MGWKEALLQKLGADRTSPFPGRTYPATSVMGGAERGEAVQGADVDLELCDLTVEFASGQEQTQQLDAVHLGLCSASVLIASPSSPDGSPGAF